SFYFSNGQDAYTPLEVLSPTFTAPAGHEITSISLSASVFANGGTISDPADPSIYAIYVQFNSGSWVEWNGLIPQGTTSCRMRLYADGGWHSLITIQSLEVLSSNSTYNLPFTPIVIDNCIDSTAVLNLTINQPDGCTDSTAFNYDVNAVCDDGSCIPFVYGCTDTTALNYDVLANTDDGSCLNCYAVADINNGLDSIIECDSVLISTNSITNGSYCWNYTNATNNVNTNYSLEFTGNGYVDFGPSNDIVPNTSYPLTISWKYHPNANNLPSGGNEDFMFWRGVHNNGSDYQMFAYYDGTTFRMYGSGAGSGLQYNIDLVSNPTWADFTVVIDLNSSPNSILYVDGVFAASADVSYNMSGTPTGIFKIGQHSNSYNRGFMDEFMIFNTALTQQEIQSNINCLPSADESNLLRYWRFEEGTGWTIYDEIPNSTNDGNLVNNIHWSSSVLPTLNCQISSSVCSDSTNSMVVLTSGWNSITVTDSLGCTATDSVYVHIQNCIYGCTDPSATNFDATATVDD
ncbi:MAG: LamG-like jellyroll fold domain-containing protein, partial [Methylophagaceae bacterium]